MKALAPVLLALILAGCGGAAAPASPGSSPAAPRTAPASAASASAAVPAPSGKALEKMKVSYPTFSASVAPLLIAIDKGYYSAEGLDIEMIRSGGGASTPALIAGEVPYTTSSGSALSAMISGAPLKVIYTAEDRPGYELWTTDPSIKSIKDIKGKAVAIQTRGDTNEIAMNILLKNNGLPSNSVTYVATGAPENSVAALQSGQVPLAVMGASNALQYKTSGGTGHLLVDLKKEVQMVYTGLATSDKELQQNRDRTKRFLRGTIKGLEYFKAFKSETLAILAKYNHLPEAANEVDYDDDIPALTADGTVSVDVQRADTAVRAQMVNVAPPSVTKLYDYSVLNEVNKELKASGWKPER